MKLTIFETDILSNGNEAQDVVDLLPGALTQAEEDAINTFVDAQVAGGNWDLLEEFFCFGLSDVVNSLTGWKGKKVATNIGATRESFGYSNAGANSIDTNWSRASDAEVSSPGDYQIGTFIKSNAQNAGPNQGVCGTITDGLVYNGSRYSSTVGAGSLQSDVFFSSDLTLVGSVIGGVQSIFINGERVAVGYRPDDTATASFTNTVFRAPGGLGSWAGGVSCFWIAKASGFDQKLFNKGVFDLMRNLSII